MLSTVNFQSVWLLNSCTILNLYKIFPHEVCLRNKTCLIISYVSIIEAYKELFKGVKSAPLKIQRSSNRPLNNYDFIHAFKFATIKKYLDGWSGTSLLNLAPLEPLHFPNKFCPTNPRVGCIFLYSPEIVFGKTKLPFNFSNFASLNTLRIKIE